MDSADWVYGHEIRQCGLCGLTAKYVHRSTVSGKPYHPYISHTCTETTLGFMNLIGWSLYIEDNELVFDIGSYYKSGPERNNVCRIYEYHYKTEPPYPDRIINGIKCTTIEGQCACGSLHRPSDWVLDYYQREWSPGLGQQND